MARALVATVVIIVIGSISSLPFPISRGCEKEGVFCFDVDSNNSYSNGHPVAMKEGDVKLSITISRVNLTLADGRYQWLIWMGNELRNSKATIIFTYDRFDHHKVYQFYRLILNMNEENGTTHVTLDVFRKAIPPNPPSALTHEEKDRLFGRPQTDENSLAGTTVKRVADALKLDTEPIMTVAWFGFDGEPDPSNSVISHEFEPLFKELRVSNMTEKRTAGKMSEWIWLAIGVAAVVALILLIILMLFGINYVRYKISTTQETATFVSQTTKDFVIDPHSRK